MTFGAVRKKSWLRYHTLELKVHYFSTFGAHIWHGSLQGVKVKVLKGEVALPVSCDYCATVVQEPHLAALIRQESCVCVRACVCVVCVCVCTGAAFYPCIHCVTLAHSYRHLHCNSLCLLFACQSQILSHDVCGTHSPDEGGDSYPSFSSSSECCGR